MAKNKIRVLPGFGLSLGYTVFYLSLIVLIPLLAVFLKAATLNWHDFWHIVTDPRVVASYKITVGAALSAAAANAIFGLIVAWVLVRYSFPGRKIIDGLIDLPFALPTAVAGIALTAVYSKKGALSGVDQLWTTSLVYLESKFSFLHVISVIGRKITYDRPGIFIALIFIGLPFVVRTLQPIIRECEPELEEIAATLGASRLQTLRRVVLPELLPALITGFALAFARALGEYGSVIFIAGNKPMYSEITSLLIVTKLEQYDYQGATAIAAVMLVISFILLLIINLLQKWSQRYRKS